jgi:hypothetical protein
MAWIPSYQSVASHRKTLRLCALLGIRPPQAVGHLHILWHWALDNAGPDGDLGDCMDAEIAMAAMWDGDPSLFIEALIRARFLDLDEGGRRRLHNWTLYGGKVADRRRRESDRIRSSRGSARDPVPGSGAQDPPGQLPEAAFQAPVPDTESGPAAVRRGRPDGEVAEGDVEEVAQPSSGAYPGVAQPSPDIGIDVAQHQPDVAQRCTMFAPRVDKIRQEEKRRDTHPAAAQHSGERAGPPPGGVCVGDDPGQDAGIGPRQVLEAWNRVCAFDAVLPRAIRLTDLRRRKIQARQAEDPGRRSADWWERYFALIRASPFCRGDGGRGWRADIDWAVRSEDVVTRVLEGSFSGGKGGGGDGGRGANKDYVGGRWGHLVAAAMGPDGGGGGA